MTKHNNTAHIIPQLMRDLICLSSAILCLASCQKDQINLNRGEDRVDETDLISADVMLRSESTVGDIAFNLLTEGGSHTVETVYAYSSNPLKVDQTVIITPDLSLVETYAAEKEMEYKPLPAPFYEIGNHGVATIPAEKSVSENINVKLYVTNPLGNRLEAGRYLLPLRLKSSAQQASEKIFYISLKIREPFEGNAPLYRGEDAFFVFYINTADYDPRLVTDYLIDKDGPDPDKCWYCTVGNIINLRKTSVGYDASSGRAMFSLSTDMRYVLDHYDTYILPLQEEGRKVCLSIEGGGTGLGFCNMTDSQIKDFVEQVKNMMDTWPIDGINLWDRNSGYDKSEQNGHPETNTTSYPKLIKALREMLGPDRLLTLADHEQPTEYFWDTEATGGIEAGTYLDYAWSGYCNSNEGLQVVDPYNPEGNLVSTLHVRKPIAGLGAEKYGCINYPWRPSLADWSSDYQKIHHWSKLSSNNIILFEDLRTNLQDNMEMSWHEPFTFCITKNHALYGGEYMYLFDNTLLEKLPNLTKGYGKWTKDW